MKEDGKHLMKNIFFFTLKILFNLFCKQNVNIIFKVFFKDDQLESKLNCKTLTNKFIPFSLIQDQKSFYHKLSFTLD